MSESPNSIRTLRWCPRNIKVQNTTESRGQPPGARGQLTESGGQPPGARGQLTACWYSVFVLIAPGASWFGYWPLATGPWPLLVSGVSPRAASVFSRIECGTNVLLQAV